jgi:hypothetical protein
MRNDRSWFAPLTGAAFVVLVIVAFAIGGEPPNAKDDSAQEIAKFYGDNEGKVILGAALAAIAATLFVFFGGYLRSVLREGEGEGGILSAVALAGTIIFATGLAIDSSLTFALADTADDIDPAAVEALNAYWENDFVPFAVGLQTLMFAVGLSALRRGTLPKWVGVIAILIAVVAVTPIGFGAVIAAGILILVLSVMLTMRERSRGGGETPAV